tara:strand:- start:886 stop:1146 length:261 start_codon:yes stop_codon:yes gene_type:complete
MRKSSKNKELIKIQEWFDKHHILSRHFDFNTILEKEHKKQSSLKHRATEIKEKYNHKFCFKPEPVFFVNDYVEPIFIKQNLKTIRI